MLKVPHKTDMPKRPARRQSLVGPVPNSTTRIRTAWTGPDLWNSLPLTVRDPSLSLAQFCAQLKTVMFSRAQ